MPYLFKYLLLLPIFCSFSSGYAVDKETINSRSPILPTTFTFDMSPEGSWEEDCTEQIHRKNNERTFQNLLNEAQGMTRERLEGILNKCTIFSVLLTKEQLDSLRAVAKQD